ncbi:COG4705 family protein [Caballeronia sp. HLA56]
MQINTETQDRHDLKVPAVTLGFWLIKIAATTLGETGGDWVTMSLNLGYLVGSAIFAILFIGFVMAQVRAKGFHPSFYWITIVATTTLGTTLADFADRSVGLGYPGGVSLIVVCLVLCIFLWYRVEGTVAVSSVTTPRAEWFYWITILFSQTLGTAVGDWLAGDDRGGLGLGYEVSALIFGTLLLAVCLMYFFTQISHTLLFWLAFVLTRPLGATLGDFFDKPVDQGGLAFSRFTASVVLIVAMVAAVWITDRVDKRKAAAYP